MIHDSAPEPTAPVGGSWLLGEGSVGYASDLLRPGRAEAFHARARHAGQAAGAYLYVSPASTASTITVGIYADDRGQPGVLLTSGSVPAAPGGGWLAVPLPPIALHRGVDYWVAILGAGGVLRYRDRAGGPCRSLLGAQAALTGLPDWWRTRTSYRDCPLSLVVSTEAPRDGAEAAATRAGAPEGLAEAAAEPQLEVPPLPPLDLSAPEIGGSAQQGQVLSASDGEWSGEPSSFSYQWEDCDFLGVACLDVPGATGPSYALGSGDVGDTVRVAVTAANAVGSTEAISPATAAVIAEPPPSSISAPTIAGAAVVGRTLSADEGEWTGEPSSFSYQWQLCNAAGEACASIPAATRSSYRLISADVGRTVRVLVTASNDGGSGEASSGPSASILAEGSEAPVSTAVPVLTGSAVEGQVLSTSNGSWEGDPTSFSYEWEDCNAAGLSCTRISGAGSDAYRLAAADVGHTVRAIVTATNADGSTPASSGVSAKVLPLPPVNSTPPSIGGFAVEGDTLTASNGGWEGAPTSFAYQWEDCNATGGACVHIAGATVSIYGLLAGDVGHTVRVVVTATNAGGSTQAVSPATSTVAPAAPQAPVELSPPVISGSALEGQTLSASSGVWEGSPSSFSYQWEDCNTSGRACTEVPGATRSRYVLGASDVGHTVRVIVTATNAGGSAQASSAASATVTAEAQPAPVDLVLPVIAGLAVEGQTLSVTKGTWSNSPTSFAYQWQDCNSAGRSCTEVAGATGSTYQLTSGDVGHTVRVVVTASNAGGATPVDTLVTTVVLPIAPSNVSPPTISGSPVEGHRLSAGNGVWEGVVTSFAYQWQDCNAAGGSCTSIGGATASTYPLTSGDVGHTVRVMVTASNPGGSGEASSPASALVTAESPGSPPVNSSLPQISGDAVEGDTLSASNGSWSNGPTSFAYAWQDCARSGEECSAIAGATRSTYRLAARDVEHTVRVVVTASNEAGSTPATSPPTGTVAATSPESPSLTARECFENPGPAGEETANIEACGYPGFRDTGVEPGVSLKEESGSVYFTASGWENTTTHEHGTGNWEGHRLKGVIYIQSGAKPVTLKNDEVFTEGLCRGELCFVNSVNFPSAGEAGVSGFVFSHDRFGGSAKSGANVVQTCVNDESNGTYVAEYVKTIYCSGYKCNNGCELRYDYCPSNYEIAGEHYECVAVQGVAGKAANPVKIVDSTVFQPPPNNYGEGLSFPGAGPTSAVFLQEEYGELGELVLERDFLAGGAEAILDEWRGSGETKLTVKQTRFARCLSSTCPTVPSEELRFGQGAGTGLQKIRGNNGDGHGWFEHVGLYSVLYKDLKGSRQTWQENFYDDGLQAISLAEAQ